MALTTEQLTTLGNHIRNNAAVADALAGGNLGDIRDWYNGIASPDFWVLNTNIDVDQAIEEGIDWDADYAALDEKDATILLLLFANGSFAVEKPGGRDALNKVFTGATSSKSKMLALATHKATELQKLFKQDTTGPGGGDGSTQTQSAIAFIKGPLTTAEVDRALELTA